jgi:hypothetical protein
MKCITLISLLLIVSCNNTDRKEENLEGTWYVWAHGYSTNQNVSPSKLQPTQIYNHSVNDYRLANFIEFRNNKFTAFIRSEDGSFENSDMDFSTSEHTSEFGRFGNRIYLDNEEQSEYYIEINNNILKIVDLNSNGRMGPFATFYKRYDGQFKPQSWTKSLPKFKEEKGNDFTSPYFPSDMLRTNTIHQATTQTISGDNDIYQFTFNENTNYEIIIFNPTYKKVEVFDESGTVLLETIHLQGSLIDGDNKSIYILNEENRKLNFRISGKSGYYRIYSFTSSEIVNLNKNNGIQLK